MYELLPDIERWIDQNKRIGLATVINTWGSSPRQVGAKMAFTPHHQISGSVSGGCVEGAVIEAGLKAIDTGQPEMLHYGVADEMAFSVGLACGGNIEIFVRELDVAQFKVLKELMESRTPFALVTALSSASELFGHEMVVSEGEIVYGSFGKDIDEQVVNLVHDPFELQKSQVVTLNLPSQEPLDLFLDMINPPPRLIIVGGVHIAIALAALAKSMGFYVVVVDPRKAFCTAERFPQADQLIQAWPEEAFQQLPLTASTSIAILPHDPKIDDPAIRAVIDSPVQYIGVLGSQATHASRRQRLLEQGLTPQQLTRLHAPIGLDLGGNSPQEIALSVLAEIIAVRNGQNLILGHRLDQALNQDD